MQLVRKLPGTSFRTKVLAPMILVMLAMLAVTVWFVDYRINQQIKEDARGALKTDQELFRSLQLNHLNYLRLRFQSLANESGYRAALDKQSDSGQHDFNTITNTLARMLEHEDMLTTNVLSQERIAFLLFTPEEPALDQTRSMIQIRSPNSSATAFVAACGLNVRRAQSAENLSSPLINDAVSVKGQLVNLISIPLYTQEHFRMGVLTLGETIGRVTAQEYSLIPKNPIIFFADGKAVASTVPSGVDAETMAALFQRLAHSQTGTGRTVESTTIGPEHYLCASGSFPSWKADPAMGYLLFSSYDPSSNVLHTQKLLLGVSLVVMLLGSLVVWLIVHRTTQPLVELRTSAEAVGRGDFSQTVTVRTRDEFGQLSRAFNQMSENIEQAQTELTRMVETLKSTQAQLVQSEKLSAVGEFVAGVAHELNNPLAAVMGFSELLRTANVAVEYREDLDIIFKSSQRCQRIVQSLLSFARRHPPERKLVSLNPLIQDVLQMIAYQLRTSNVAVVTDFAPQLPLVLADGHQLQQVVLNVINNARQAIQAHQPTGTITVTTKAVDAKIEIIIQDSGPGISRENLKKIFDPFFTTKEVGQGTGLGLSLCYGLIKEHGGNISARSQSGAGATFTIELPATGDLNGQAIPDQNQGGGPVNPFEGAGKSILVVDDEEMLLELMRQELVRHGYHVVVAINGDAALGAVRAKKFDVILCDLKMPGLNGRQVYERLRTEKPEVCPRFIFVTGDIINETLEQFLELEQRHCLTKPFALPELRDAIKNVLVASPSV